MQLVENATNFVIPLDEKMFCVTRPATNAQQFLTSSLVGKLTNFIVPFKGPSTRKSWERAPDCQDIQNFKSRMVTCIFFRLRTGIIRDTKLRFASIHLAQPS